MRTNPTSPVRATSRVLLHGVGRYALAVGAVVVATAVRWALPEILSPAPYLAFYPTVVAAAAFGGFGPGILATVLAIVSLDLLFIPPVGEFSHDPVVWVRQAMFFAGGLGLSLVARMLRQSLRKYRAVAEYTHDWEFWLAPDGRYSYVSPSCLNVTGYPAEAFLADPELADRIIHPDDQAHYKEHRGYGHEACATPEVEFRIIHRDGAVRWIGHACVPIFDEAGTFLGIRGSNRDITERKLAEQALADSQGKLAGIITSAMDAIITIDESQRVLLFNPAAEKMFGLPAREAIGGSVERFIPERFRAVHAGHIRQFGTTGATSRAMGHLGAISGRRASGEEFPIEASISQVSVEGKKLFSVILRDITDRQFAEEGMIAAKVAAEHASQAKDHFLAVLSHELRNPLAPVLATASLLQQDDRFDQQTKDHLEVIRRNAELEARLIDDLLDVTRISRGKVELDLRPVELSTILRHAVEVCKPDIESRHLHFHLEIKDPPHLVNADAGRLQQVFWNMIKNAVKFTPHDGSVGVRCWRDGSQVLVEICDSGVGIEPEALTRIFNAFEQAERSVTRQFGGLGLGLAISKALVEMHGGTITAHSEGKGKGATFIVCLPLSHLPAPVAPVRPDQAAGKGVPVAALRILLVEDHGDTARVMTQVLAREGHEICAAGDVATALELADSQPFDLMLSDLGLPDGSGMDLLRALRGRGYLFPAIALSGYGQEQDIRQSLAAGFALHLTKPVNMPRLTEAVTALVSNTARDAGQKA